MKRSVLFLTALLLGIFLANAQHVKMDNKDTPFLFEKFEEADVIFRDGTRYRETINYNLLTNQFYFLDKPDGEMKVVSNPEDIYLVKVGDRCFYQEKGYAVEVIPTNPPLFVQYKAHIRKEAGKGAYGMPSETSSIRTYGGFNSNGNRYELKKESLIISKRYQHYWLEKKGKRRAFKNFEQFVKFYPEHKKTLEKFIEDNELYFDNVEHVKILCVYAESL